VGGGDSRDLCPGCRLGGSTYLVVNALLLWGVGRWRPSLVFDTREARAALRFGLTASLATFAGSLAGQIERFAIAGLFGPAALGHYGAARNLNRDALRNLMVVSDNVLLPGLAMLQVIGRARACYLHALRYECVVFALCRLVLASRAICPPRLRAGVARHRLVQVSRP
jgi:O-antigen/teichoic acid export membrane protein